MPDSTDPKAGDATSDDVALHDLVPAESSTPTATPVPVEPVETGYTADGVPTFDYAREKIETRYGAAVGSAELSAETPEGRSVEEQYEARQRAASDRLAQIRESMRSESSPEDQA